MAAKTVRIDAILAALHTRRIVAWDPAFGRYPKLYDELKARVLDGSLTAHQCANALVVMFRLRRKKADADLFEVVRRCLTHPTVRVRDQACALAIGLMRYARWEPAFYSERVREELQTARQMGLSPSHASSVDALLTVGPSAVELK